MPTHKPKSVKEKEQYDRGHEFYRNENLKRAVREWKTLAESDDADAQYRAKARCELGRCYDEGHGVVQDTKEAARLWNLAMAQSHVGAKFSLGHCYCAGTGVVEDETKGMRLIKQAADEGDPKAKKGMEKLKLAAKQGNADAQSLLDCLKKKEKEQYDRGHEFYRNENFKRAVREWKTLAESDDADAQYRAKARYELVRCYDKGRGVAKDFGEAVCLYNLAVAQFAPKYSLGIRYCNGVGVVEDEKKGLDLIKQEEQEQEQEQDDDKGGSESSLQRRHSRNPYGLLRRQRHRHRQRQNAVLHARQRDKCRSSGGGSHH